MKPIDWMTERERHARIKGGCVVVCNRYDIPLDRCSTKIEAYQWLVHLLEKNWVTREVLFDLVDVLQRYFGYNLHDGSGTDEG